MGGIVVQRLGMLRTMDVTKLISLKPQPTDTVRAIGQSRLLVACMVLVHAEPSERVLVTLKNLYQAARTDSSAVSSREDVKWYLSLETASPNDWQFVIPHLRQLGCTVGLRTKANSEAPSLQRAPFWLWLSGRVPTNAELAEEPLALLEPL